MDSRVISNDDLISLYEQVLSHLNGEENELALQFKEHLEATLEYLVS